MTSGQEHPGKDNRIADLRQRAEQKLRLINRQAKMPAEVEEIIHELQVYQVELEMQFEELRNAKWALEKSEAQYRSLYQLAPNGYFTLNEKGGIQNLNFTGARLLGVERRPLLDRLLRGFIPAGADREAFDGFFAALAQQSTVQRCEVRLLSAQGEQRTLLLEGVVQEDEDPSNPNHYLIIAIDITERQQTEARRQEEHRRLKDAQALGHIGSFEQDVSSQRLIWSDELYRMHGLPPQSREISFEQMVAWVHPDDQAALRSAIRLTHTTGTPLDLVNRIVRPDGSVRYVHRRAERLYLAGMPAKIYGTVQDITEQKEAADQLRQGKELLHSVFNVVPHGIGVLQSLRDEYGHLTDFEYVLANRAIELLAPGVNPIGRRFSQTRCGLKPNGLLEMFREVACSGRAGHLETFDSFGGRDSWYGVRAVPFADGVVFSFEDITERKQAEEEERKYHEQLAQMLNALPQMAWVYGATGELIFFNERWYAYTGLGEKPSKEQGWQAAVHPSDIDRTRDALVQSTANHTPLELEIRCRRHDGAYRWHLSRAVPILRDDGSVGLWVGTATDIHDLKLAETQLRTMEVSRQKELTHVILEAQEEEKQRISEALHNGLAQQLYAVRLQLENVQLEPHPEKLADSEAAKRKTEALLLEAIHQTRELSHELSPAMLEDYGLQEAIEHFCRNLTHQGLRLRCRFEDLPSRLEKPLEIAIYRISQELATNIVKHAQASGASILIRQDHKRISLEARDNGVGFAPGKPNQKGLGLRAIENRVKLLGGTLSIESVPDEGTLIRIQMPWGQPGA